MSELDTTSSVNDSIAEAKLRLNSLMENFQPIDMTKTQTKGYWHVRLRVTEIDQFGDESPYALIPTIRRIHSYVAGAFLNNNIHTKSEIATLSELDIRRLRGPRNARFETTGTAVLWAIRNLAKAQLDQQV